MSDILKKAKQHYLDRLDKCVKIIEVPEWDEKIYVEPVNIVDRDKVREYAKTGTLKSLVDCIILRAKDVNREPHFTQDQRQELLLELDSALIIRLATQINIDIDTVGDEFKTAGKNS